jgi:Pyruvate/2-oxoacid:ferredoxin oxidoreductase delta subunit
MDNDNLAKLAGALDRLPNGFPRTASGIELRILQKIFLPEEAALACELTGTYETIKEIADRVGGSAGEIGPRLVSMAQKGQVWFMKQDGRAMFRLAPFIVGIYEAQVDVMDHELAHLVEDYFHQGGNAALMQPQPAFHRVIPAARTVKTEWIMPYDDIRKIILDAKTFNAGDCICRVQQNLIGDDCKFPVKTCLTFFGEERAPRPGDISQQEALDLLDQFEKIGLVHTVSNVATGLFYVCNCCGCCCGILRGITEFGINDSVARSNYYAVIDTDSCQNCGVCIERCQVAAISEADGVSVVDTERCIGCGLCVSGCAFEAVRLERRADAEMIHPPADFQAWEEARSVSRGLR